MNYKAIILRGYTEHATQKAPYVSYFKQQAQINKRDNFIEFADFFNGCKIAIKGYKDEIAKQYNKEISDCNFMIDSYRKGNVKNERGNLITDQTELNKGMEIWEQQKQDIVDSRINSINYKCNILDTGEITNDRLLASCSLYHSDIISLEQGIIQAEKELIEPETNPLAINEYTQKSEIIKNGTQNLKIIYSALTKTSREASNNNIEQFYDLAIINDLRRIEQHYKEKPNECIKFIKTKYKMIWSISTVFIESLKLIIDENSVFMLLLKHQAMWNTLNKKVQQDFALKLNEARKQFEVPEKPQSNPKSDKETEIIEEKPQRTIDEERLKSYFLSPFKGMGNGNINHFETMIEEFKTDRTAKEFAQIALMIYESQKMSDRKTNTFAEWYSIFCKCVDCDRKTYKPSQLKPFPEKLTKLFNYLT